MGNDEVGQNHRPADDSRPDGSSEGTPDSGARADAGSPDRPNEKDASRLAYNSIRNAWAHGMLNTHDPARLADEGEIEEVQRWLESSAAPEAADVLAYLRHRSAHPSHVPEGNATAASGEFDARMSSVQAQWDEKFAELRRSFTILSTQYEAIAKQYELNSRASETLKTGLEASASQLQASETRVTELTGQVKLFESKLSGTEHRSIEVVGLLSSIVALVLVSATTANSQSNPVSAYLIIVVAAAGLTVFACLLHTFFQPSSPRPFWRYWLPFALIPALAVVAAGLLLFWTTYIGVLL